MMKAHPLTSELGFFALCLAAPCFVLDANLAKYVLKWMTGSVRTCAVAPDMIVTLR